MQVSAVRACVGVIAETTAQLPLPLYQRTGDGGKRRAPESRLYEVLHDAPNDYMDSGQFIELLQTHALLLGDGYARIVTGPKGQVDQLIPLAPGNVHIEKLQGGSFRYQVRGDDGMEQPVNAEDIFHLPGLSLDGMRGLALTTSSREAIGLALAAEHWGAMFFAQGSRPSFALKTPGRLDADDAGNLSKDLRAKLSGLKNAHKIAILEQGLDVVQLGADPKDSQLQELRHFQVEEIARAFRVPLHMISSTTKETSWGSGIAQMSLGFVIFTLTRHLRRWEMAIGRQLITGSDYFAEFLLDGLLRGDPATRGAFYVQGLTNGWLSINDVRRLENMNPIGPEGDIYRVQLNLAPATQQADPAPAEDMATLIAGQVADILTAKGFGVRPEAIQEAELAAA